MKIQPKCSAANVFGGDNAGKTGGIEQSKRAQESISSGAGKTRRTAVECGQEDINHWQSSLSPAYLKIYM